MICAECVEASMLVWIVCTFPMEIIRTTGAVFVEGTIEDAVSICEAICDGRFIAGLALMSHSLP